MASQALKHFTHNPVVLIWPDNVYLWLDDVRPGDLDLFDDDYNVVDLNDEYAVCQYPNWLIRDIKQSIH